MSNENLTILAVALLGFLLYRMGWFRLPGPRPAPVPPTPPAPSAQAPVPHYIVLPSQAPPPAPAEDGEEIVHETSISVPFKIRVLPQPPSQQPAPPAAAARIGF